MTKSISKGYIYSKYLDSPFLSNKPMGVLHFSAHFQMPTQNFGYPPFFVEAVTVADTLLENTQALPQQHEAKLHPDVVTYNSIIAACERCGIWAKALELLNLMEEAVGFSGGGM